MPTLNRTARLAAAVLVLGLAAGACSSDDGGDVSSSGDSGSSSGSGSGSGVDDTSAAGDLDLVTDDQLTVCSDIPYPPFEFESEDGDGYTGFDIELLEAIAADNGLTLEVKVTPFDGILGAVAAGDCDLVGSALSITDERKEQVLFSDPYFTSEQSLLVLAEDEETYPDLASLAGKTIGVQAGTTGEAYAEENLPDGATIKSFEGGSDLFPALLSGDIDGALQDFPVNAFQASQDDQFTVVATFGEGEDYGFAAAKENEALISAVNASLGTLKDDGTYDEIYATWFGEDK